MSEVKFYQQAVSGLSGLGLAPSAHIELVGINMDLKVAGRMPTVGQLSEILQCPRDNGGMEFNAHALLFVGQVRLYEVPLATCPWPGPSLPQRYSTPFDGPGRRGGVLVKADEKLSCRIEYRKKPTFVDQIEISIVVLYVPGRGL